MMFFSWILVDPEVKFPCMRDRSAACTYSSYHQSRNQNQISRAVCSSTLFRTCFSFRSLLFLLPPCITVVDRKSPLMQSYRPRRVEIAGHKITGLSGPAPLPRVRYKQKQPWLEHHRTGPWLIVTSHCSVV
jgi:hypothetical protein